MTKVICSWCTPTKVIREVEPMSDPTEIPAICPECYQKLVEQQSITAAPIPEKLGACDILKIHDDGDLTVTCQGNKYVITTEGEVFQENKDLENLRELATLDNLEKLAESAEIMPIGE